MSRLRPDIYYAIRLLRKTPAFTLTAIVTLALGVGANTAVFSLAKTLLMRPVPGVTARDVFHITARGEDGEFDAIFSYDDYLYLKRRSSTLDVVTHYSTAPLTEDAPGASREVRGAVVSADFFSALGVRPARGRFFTAEEGLARGGAPAAVISDAFWRERFGGSPDVIGTEIRLNGVIFTVVGIAPADFHGVLQTWHNDVWLPLSMLATGYRWCDPFQPDCDTLNLLGKLRSGTSLGQARAELAALSRQLESVRAGDERLTLSLSTLDGLSPGPGREGWARDIGVLLVAATLLLVVACANLAGTLLSSGLTRRGEFVVRMALGAGPARIKSQLITESLMLAMLGGGLGIVVSYSIQRVLNGMYAIDSEGYPIALGLHLDPLIVAFALGLALATGVAFGLAPAVSAGRSNVSLALSEHGPRVRSRSRLIGALAVVQVGLTFAALVGAGLLLRSVTNVRAAGGFDAKGVALFRVRPRLVGYEAARAQAYTRDVLRRLEVMPGVRSATVVGIGAVWGEGDDVPVWRPDAVPADRRAAPRARYNEIAPRLFETLGATVLEGREFDDRDRAGTELVAIVDDVLAGRHWPEGSALGRTIVVDGRERRVVGVVRNPYLRSAIEPARAHAWTPYWQNPNRIDARFAVRVAGDPAARLSDLVHAAREVDPAVPVTEALTMRSQIGAAFRSVRTVGLAVSYAGLLAMVLAGLGLYGILGFAVNAGRRAIAVRKALGAAPMTIVMEGAGHVAGIVIRGAALGLLLGLVASRVLARLVYGISPWEPKVFVAAGVVLLLVSALASWAPIRRAVRIAPREALAETSAAPPRLRVVLR